MSRPREPFYLLIDAATRAATRRSTKIIKGSPPVWPFWKRSMSVCSCCDARWGRCCTRRRLHHRCFDASTRRSGPRGRGHHITCARRGCLRDQHVRATASTARIRPLADRLHDITWRVPPRQDRPDRAGPPYVAGASVRCSRIEPWCMTGRTSRGFPRAGGGAPGGRGRPLHPRNVP